MSMATMNLLSTTFLLPTERKLFATLLVKIVNTQGHSTFLRQLPISVYPYSGIKSLKSKLTSESSQKQPRLHLS